jgi:uncharacterized protein (TIGR00255 family)
MTGFSKLSSETELGSITVEIYGLNHKYRDIHIHLPRIFSACEDALRKKITDAVARGKVRVVVTADSQSSGDVSNYTVNMEYAGAYIKALRKIQQEFSLPGEISIDIFADNREILLTQQLYFEDNAALQCIGDLIDQALENFFIEQEKEGVQLINDIVSRIKLISDTTDCIEKETPHSVNLFREKLTERIKELQVDSAVDADRIAKEVALYADRIDISEEIVRLKSHIKHFSQAIDKGGIIGKKLDFIAQEMSREINTIAAKCNNVSISHKTITVRSELEKIREQVQNIQ